MRILVTGNCGFIGQNFVSMYKDKHDIVGMDMLTYASDRNALALCPTVVGDISNPYDLERAFALGPFDAVVNFAAFSHVDNSIASPEPFLKSNVNGTFYLLEMVRKHGGRFVQISTDETMGFLRLEDPPFSDPYHMRPSSPYSAAKAAADCFVIAYGHTFGMDVVITKSCNNYGPFQFHEKLVAMTITNALADRPVLIHGRGEQIREWIWVEDNCRGVMAALEHGKRMGIYHLGSGLEMRNIDIATRLLDIMGKPQSLIRFVEDRKGNDFRYLLDSSQTHAELGWHADTPFDHGLRQTVGWYAANPSYWARQDGT